MDSLLKQKIIHSAKHLWDQGNLLEAGMLLFERIPLSFRPLWGADLLAFASQRFSDVPQIQDVIAFGRTPHEWANDTSLEQGKKAHKVFDSVRLLTLEEGQKDMNNNLYGNLLLLAENVAKVTYNAYSFAAPFDHDAGWWIIANLRRITDLVNDNDFSAAAWKVLTNEAYIELEAPIRCNPQCPTCLWLQTFEIK
jgi:hypothetical protein